VNTIPPDIQAEIDIIALSPTGVTPALRSAVYRLTHLLHANEENPVAFEKWMGYMYDKMNQAATNSVDTEDIIIYYSDNTDNVYSTYTAHNTDSKDTKKQENTTHVATHPAQSW
jgi:hypothetical protein